MLVGRVGGLRTWLMRAGGRGIWGGLVCLLVFVLGFLVVLLLVYLLVLLLMWECRMNRMLEC